MSEHRIKENALEFSESKHGLLTQREVECLYWTSQGKSAEEIGMLLNIKKRTVNSYLLNVKEKLNAVKIAQAVYIASKKGLL